jgi:hypothetical protein
MTSHDILPTTNTIATDTEALYRMKADAAHRRLNEIVADMEAQTPVSELLSKYGLEMLCARTCLEIEPAILLGNTSMVRELRQQ